MPFISLIHIFIYISMNSWILLLFYELESSTIVVYFLTQVFISAIRSQREDIPSF